MRVFPAQLDVGAWNPIQLAMVRFDLRGETPAGYRRMLVAFRWGLVLFDVFIAVYAVLFVVQMTGHGHPTIANVTGLVFSIFWIAVTGWVIWMLDSSATFLEVDDQRVRFEFSAGRYVN